MKKFICCWCGGTPQMPGSLYAFDFDHTIVNDNSDTAVLEVIHKRLPEQITKIYDGTNWTIYMDNVFKYVAAEGGTVDEIGKRIGQLAPTAGMTHLLNRICLARLENRNNKLLIVSDANTFFIETYLRSLNPPVKPDKVITNHADPSCPEGYLKLTPYETQTHCPICPRNLCKGTALHRYIETQGPFERVYYSCDGGNDICPAQALSENDVVFVRKGYAMERIIKNGAFKGLKVDIKAKIVYWEDAKTIEQEMNF